MLDSFTARRQFRQRFEYVPGEVHVIPILDIKAACLLDGLPFGNIAPVDHNVRAIYIGRKDWLQQLVRGQGLQ